MIGMRTASYTCQTIRSASGKTAGPLRPPVTFFSTGCFVFRSIRMAITVLMRLSASAPASSHACAIETTSVTFGVSFTMTGFLTAAFTAAVTSAALSQLVPKPMPPPCTFGQEMFTSSQPTCGQASNFRATSTYSSTEKPQTFAMIGL